MLSTLTSKRCQSLHVYCVIEADGNVDVLRFKKEQQQLNSYETTATSRRFLNITHQHSRDFSTSNFIQISLQITGLLVLKLVSFL